MSDSFICHLPISGVSPIIFNSPHSGRRYERTFLNQTALNWREIRASEDSYVDTLLDSVTDFGSVLIEACFPRSFVDLNRSYDELDTKLIDIIKKRALNPRISAGLGVIPRITGNGLEIYRRKISMIEVYSRLQKFYFPYHTKLKKLIKKAKFDFGFSILFDFHSMPHNSLQFWQQKKTFHPEIILGDCFGSSCSSWLSETVFDIFSSEGFRVETNVPFSGGFITRNYGNPKKNIHVIQVEIDRSLYMNEVDFTLHEGYPILKQKLNNVIYNLSEIKNKNKVLLLATD